jgi:hypothetical protein
MGAMLHLILFILLLHKISQSCRSVLNQFKVAIIQETKVAKQKEWQRERKQGASLVDGQVVEACPTLDLMHSISSWLTG